MSDGKKGSPLGTERFSRLKSMMCFEDMDEKIRGGYPISEIAAWIQDEEHECDDVQRNSLVTMLHEYRKSLATAELIAPVMPQYVANAKKEMDDGLNEADELVKLYKIQEERIKMGFELEKKLRVPNRALDGQITTAMHLLAKRHEIKMDLGIGGGRDLGTLHLRPELMADVASRYGDTVRDAMADPEARGKVLAMTQRLTNLVKGGG